MVDGFVIEPGMERLQPIREHFELDDAAIRRDVIASGRPAVLRGLVASWPAVERACSSASALANYLRQFDTGCLIDAIMTRPEMKGRIFYTDALDGFNYVRNRLPLSAVVEQVLRYAAFARAPAVAAQSALIRDCVPGFLAENRLALLDESIAPRIWLGNAITTPTHLDEWCNIACVVSGRRRFTLFPPEQIANLYVGPLDFAPTGAPMSLVKLGEPDFERFPRFRQALAAAQVAELGPGDAVFIPPLWWHNVESLDAFNVLVNYWWHAGSGAQSPGGSAFDCLLHGILSIRGLPPETRTAWRALFEHYIFGTPQDVTSHIPVARHGILGQLSPEDVERLRMDLAHRLDAAGR
jgi:hypothetical protein